MAGSQGLGRAAAAALAREGAHVAVCARRKDVLEKAVEELARLSTGARVEGHVADVTNREDLQRFLRAAARLGGGRLDVLVTNNGGPPPKKFDELSDEDWRAAFELLVLSNVRAIRTALPYLRKNGGAIVNITSSAVKQPIGALVLSNSLRLAVVGLAKTLATELAPLGVRINNVCPGSFETDRIVELVRFQAEQRKSTVDQVKREREQEIPMGRMGRPEELGEVIAFLASPRASYLTGATVSVDGGLVRWTFG